jgi:hypothetical protein
VSEGRIIPHGWVAGIARELMMCGVPHECRRPASNPAHVCVRYGGHPLPHRDFSGFEWDQPEPRHTLGPP